MIRNAPDNGNFACGVFIDLQKAFDIVNHDIILSKLNHYGIRGVAFDWLTELSMQPTINNERSEIQTIKYDAPQGSILEILLFLIYINKITKKMYFNKKTRKHTTLLMIQIYYMPAVLSRKLTKK